MDLPTGMSDGAGAVPVSGGPGLADGTPVGPVEVGAAGGGVADGAALEARVGLAGAGPGPPKPRPPGAQAVRPVASAATTSVAGARRDGQKPLILFMAA